MTSKYHAAMSLLVTPRSTPPVPSARPHALVSGLRRLGCGWVALSALWLCAAAHAEKADRDKPMNAEADSLRYDDVRQLSVFTGNVVITKGSIVIRGDKVEVRQDAQGNQFGVVTGSAAKPAFFRQKREGLDEYIEGVSDRIDYNGQTDVVRFEQRAMLRRYRGATLADETSGSLIVYNNAAETFSVDGGEASKTPSNPSGRVRAMLTPTPRPAEGAPAPAATDPARLRSAPVLDGVGR